MVEWDYLAQGDFVYRDLPPIEAESALGATIIDKWGKHWIDLEAANGTLLFGYDRTLTAAVHDCWARLPTVPSFVETSIRRSYARRLGLHIRKSTAAPGKLVFDLGGAQGIELAIRIAGSIHPERKTIVVMDGCYHGRTLSLSNLSASLRYRKTVPTLGYRIVRLPVPELLAPNCGQNEKETLDFCIRFAKHVLTDQSYGVTDGDATDALAFIFEPVLNVAGLVDTSLEYLNYLLKLTQQLGCISIADEVFTGCYRMGPFLSIETLSSRPDMVVLSKALTNGLVPLSAVWARGDLADSVHYPPGTYSTTFSNTPLHFMVADKVMDRIESVQPSDVSTASDFLTEVTTRICQKLRGMVVHSLVRGITGYIEFTSEINKTEVVRRLRKGTSINGEDVGLITAGTALSRTRLMLHPPLVMSDLEKDMVLQCVEKSLV